jgi:hypothetical protein
MRKYFILLILFFKVLIVYSQNTVTVTGDLKINNGNQGAGKVLVSDSTGKVKWITKDEFYIDIFINKPRKIQQLLHDGISFGCDFHA